MNHFLVGRYQARLASEVGTIVKPHGGKLRIALAYPNRYHVGMSNVGFQAVLQVLERATRRCLRTRFLARRGSEFVHGQESLRLTSVPQGRGGKPALRKALM